MSKWGKIKVKIKGVTPLIMNRLDIEELSRAKSRIRTEKPDFEEEARKAAYIDTINGKEQLYIPAEAVFRALLNSASQRKSLGKPLSSILSGSIRIEPEKIPLGHLNYEPFIKAVRIQNDRIVKARAKVDNWEAEFYIIYDKLIEKIIPDLKGVLEEAGYRFGLLDWRPQRKGQYGIFEVVEWKVMKVD